MNRDMKHGKNYDINGSGSNLKIVNAIVPRGNRACEDDDADSLDEEIHFLLNPIWGYRPTYQRKGKNQVWMDKDRD